MSIDHDIMRDVADNRSSNGSRRFTRPTRHHHERN